MAITLIPVHDAPSEASTITFADAQKYVLGYVEVVRVDHAGSVLLVNEDGRLKKLVRNEYATFLASQVICGPAVLLTGADVDRVLNGGA